MGTKIFKKFKIYLIEKEGIEKMPSA
jgi:hypothetical protein